MIVFSPWTHGPYLSHVRPIGGSRSRTRGPDQGQEVGQVSVNYLEQWFQSLPLPLHLPLLLPPLGELNWFNLLPNHNIDGYGFESYRRLGTVTHTIHFEIFKRSPRNQMCYLWVIHEQIQIVHTTHYRVQLPPNAVQNCGRGF